MKLKSTLLSHLLFAGSSLLAVSSLQAATFSWSNLVNGTPVTDGNWSSGESWSGAIAPASASDTTLSFGMTFGSNSTAEINTLTNNVADPFLLNVLTFTGSPTAANGTNVATVNIAGSPLSLVLNGATTPVVNLNSNRSAGQGVVYNVQSNVALAADTVFTGNGTATFNFSGELSGSAFTKSGSSTLTLSAANTYTGNTTLSAGGLVLGTNSALNAGDLIVTGDSRIGFANGVNISNAIDRGTSTVTYFMASTAAASATYSGALTGSGTINIANSGSGNNQTNLIFTNAGGFTGNVVGASGNANGADYFRFTGIGDGGNFTFQKAGNRGGVTYSGTSAITFDTRQLAMGAGFGGGGTYGLNGNGIPQNAFQNIAADAAHTVTFNSDLSVGAIASSSVFYFDGSNTGNNTFAGTIGDATGANTLGIGKWGAGKWVLTGSNSYEGNTIIANGTLSVNAIDVAANNQPLGKGSLILFGYTTGSNGTLEFTGSAASSTTDKQIVIGNLTNNNHGGGGAILNNGNGSLNFTATTFNNITGVTVTTVDRTLTLGGSNTGANEIQGVIQDNVAGAAQVLLAKSGAGTWTLSGANTYSGTTTAGGGILKLNNDTALPGGTAATGGTSGLTINGGGVVGLTAASGDFLRARGTGVAQVQWTGSGGGGFAAYGGDRTVNLNNDGGTAQWNTGSFVPGAQSLILSAADSDGTLVWQNPINFAGSERTIEVNNGSAAVDARLTGVLSGGTSSGLNKTGSGTLEITNTNTYSGATTINAGTLVITGASQATSGITFTGGSLSLDIANTVAAASATVDFTNGNVTVTGTPVSASYTLLTASSITGVTPATLSPSVPGYELQVIGGNELHLVSTGAPTGFATWQAANGGSGTTGGLGDDHDNDGVSNGVEYFIGGPNGDTTGFTALPGVTNLAGTLSITFTKAADYAGVYGTDYVVETSATLANPWAPQAADPTPGFTVTFPSATEVKYTFPAGTKNFARLKVTGP